MKTMRQSAQSALTIFLISLYGCGDIPVDFDPDFYAIDTYTQELTNEDGSIRIPCSDDRAKRFLCLTEEKIVELRDILDDAVVPSAMRPIKDLYIRTLDHSLDRME